MNLFGVGRAIIGIAVMLLVIGLAILLFGKLTGGRGAPGDMLLRRDGVTIYFPIVSSIIISILLSLILSVMFWLLSRGR